MVHEHHHYYLTHLPFHLAFFTSCFFLLIFSPSSLVWACSFLCYILTKKRYKLVLDLFIFSFYITLVFSFVSPRLPLVLFLPLSFPLDLFSI